MVEPIRPIGPTQPQGPRPASAEPAPGERSFRDILRESLDKVNELQLDADQILERYLADDPEVRQEHVMVAFRKAQIAFETLMQIRNKLVDAFEEIQRMRI